jgi:hypothetical protein
VETAETPFPVWVERMDELPETLAQKLAAGFQLGLHQVEVYHKGRMFGEI